jgi:antitoxin CptB
MSMPTGTTRSSDGLDHRKKRALFRAWHRGTREMDMLLGAFADAHLGGLTDHEMDEFERLMEVPDRDIFKWITGEADTPDNYRSTVFDLIVAFHASRDRNPSRVDWDNERIRPEA